MRIGIGNDHAGFRLKEHLVKYLREADYEVLDCGTQDDHVVDFPVMTRTLTQRLLAGDVDRAFMICGSGVGACIAANKVSGVRAAVIHDTYVARQSVEHDDVNVACIGSWVVGEKVAEDVVDRYLGATFDDTDDVRRRLGQLSELEEEYRG